MEAHSYVEYVRKSINIRKLDGRAAWTQIEKIVARS